MSIPCAADHKKSNMLCHQFIILFSGENEKKILVQQKKKKKKQTFS